MKNSIFNETLTIPRIPLFFLLLIPFTLVFLNTAWVAEDAFITFRAVDNLLKGFGPVWNIGERVQVYTHPLWYFFLSIGTFVFHDSYWVAIGLSYITLAAILYIITSIIYKSKTIFPVLVLLSLLLSRAFVDYSSSGLENPLIHLFLIIYVYIFIGSKPLEEKYFFTCFIYGLIFLTRPDAITLITPASLYLFWQIIINKKRWFILSVLAIVPVIIWEFFSLIYYGSLIPNTALAKINIDYPQKVLFQQALNYFQFNLENDPFTLCIIFLSIIFSFLAKNKIPILFSAGLILQLIYIFHIGADYMLGRFLSPLVFISTIIIILTLLDRHKFFSYKALYILIASLLFFHQFPYTLKFSINFHNPAIDSFGVADERGFYFQSLGVIPVIFKHERNYKTHPWIVYGTSRSGSDDIEVSCTIGMSAWAAGEKPYYIDPLALSEPFLSRLPAKLNSRPGHYERAFPEGYFSSVITGVNFIKNPTLSNLYDDVELVVAGNLWSKERWRAIYRLNTNKYNNLDKHFDRNATGLMELGLTVSSREKFSCMGIAYGIFQSIPIHTSAANRKSQYPPDNPNLMD